VLHKQLHKLEDGFVGGFFAVITIVVVVAVHLRAVPAAANNFVKKRVDGPPSLFQPVVKSHVHAVYKEKRKEQNKRFLLVRHL
jgi:hypothetical protein